MHVSLSCSVSQAGLDGVSWSSLSECHFFLIKRMNTTEVQLAPFMLFRTVCKETCKWHGRGRLAGLLQKRVLGYGQTSLRKLHLSPSPVTRICWWLMLVCIFISLFLSVSLPVCHCLYLSVSALPTPLKWCKLHAEHLGLPLMATWAAAEIHFEIAVLCCCGFFGVCVCVCFVFAIVKFMQNDRQSRKVRGMLWIWSECCCFRLWWNIRRQKESWKHKPGRGNFVFMLNRFSFWQICTPFFLNGAYESQMHRNVARFETLEWF